MKEERKRILKMVEEGKLKVDEALSLLEELEKAQQNSQRSTLSLQIPITVMEDEHEHAGNLFKEIRSLSDNYNPPADACTTYRLSFTALQALEADLHQHIHLENNILFPMAIELAEPEQGSQCCAIG